MKTIIKRFALLTALIALFAALAVTAYADVPDPFDMSLVFAPETQLTVYVDGAWSSALSGSYGFGDKATITAPDKSESKTFSHWVAEGSIISYANPLTLTMNAHTTLYAVYANAAPTAKPVAGFTSVTRTNDGAKISFQAIASADTAGIVYSTTATGNALKIGGTGVTNEAAVKNADLTITLPNSILDENNCWMLQMTPASADTVYHARAYVTIGTETTYGDVKDVKLSDLESGVSLVANLEGFKPGTNDKLAGLTEGMHTVTYDANGGVGATIMQAFKGTSVKLRANTFTREGCTFNGWSTNQNGGGTTYADGASVTLTADTTLYAQWRSNSSGSSSSNSTETKTITAPVTGDTGTVAVTTTVKGTDATIAPLTAEQVDSIVGSNASGNQSSTVSIDVSNLGTEVKAVTIPTETVKAIEAAVSDTKKDADSLTVKLTEGSVTFDADAVKAIAAETKGDGLKVNLDDIGTEKLNTAQKSAVSDLAVETVLDAYVTSGSTRISDFKGGSATVSVKHTLKAAQSPAGIVVWYVADDGTRTQIPASFRNGEVVFTVTHFSNYVIAYDAEKAAAAGKLEAFIDLDSSAWYADGVLWALENGVMQGISPKYFSPNGDTTRAMIVTMLWRMEGSPAYVGMSEFTDVDNEQWYGQAVRWASAEGIVEGYSNTKFGPNDAVTREQLAAILYRYAQYKKANVSASADLGNFNDAASVSGWAVSAMQWAVGSGIINGMDGNLVPAGNATRAQVATMLMRYSTAK